MDKQSLLQAIKISAQQNLLTRAEVNAIFAEIDQSSLQKKLSFAAIFSYIGAAIIVLGIGVLCWEYWQLMPFNAKLGVTFGIGMFAYCLGAWLQKKWQLLGPANGFYLLSNLALFLGLWIFINKTGVDLSGSGAKTAIFALLFLLQGLSFKLFKQSIFILFAIIFASGSFFYGTDFALGHTSLNESVFFEYRFLLIGLGYLWLGYYFAGVKPLLSNALYRVGAFFFLTAALFLGGWPQQSHFWERIFPVLTFGLMFLSVYLKQKTLLILGSSYLMLYILKITDKYFADSMGWPIALMLAGLMLMGVSVITVYYSKKHRLPA